MSFGWSYPAGVSGTPYDDDPQCEIFCSPRAPSRARIEEQTQAVFDCAPDAPHPDERCECPPCPVCGEFGDANCYKEGHMPEPENTIKGFLNHIGIEPLSMALRAIDRHNLEHVWLVLEDGRRLYCDDPYADEVDAIPESTRIRSVGAGCIAWDGSCWEYSSERKYESHADVDAVRQDCIDAYDSYIAEFGEEE